MGIMATAFFKFFFSARRSQAISIFGDLQRLKCIYKESLYLASPAGALERSWSSPIQVSGKESTDEMLKSIWDVFGEVLSQEVHKLYLLLCV